MPDSTDEATVSAVRGYIASALSKWRVSVAAQKTSLTVTISDLTYGTSLSDLSGLFLTEESYSQIIVDGALYLFVWTEPPVGTLGANDMEFAGGWTNDNVKTVTVSVDGESAFETTYYVTEKDGSYTFDLGALSKPEKRGFVFTGWKSSDGDVEENVLTITGSEAHVAPEWKQITYTATYGGEAVALDGLVFTWDGTQFALKAGGVAELSDGLSRTGYTFGGWQYEGRTVHTLEELFAGSALGNAGGKEETVAIGLTAVWTENVYTVKYEANGALGSMNDRQFVYGQEAALDSNAFVFAGYDFGGWTWQGKTYADNTAFIVTEDILPEEGADIILTATWIIKTYKVAYDGREGQPERQADTADYTQTLTLPTATREGYIFLGWATEEGGNVVYADGAKVSVSMLFTGLEGVDERAATLYAVWKIHAYTVTLRGENVTLQGASVVEHGSSYTLTLTAVKGYGIPEKVSYSVGGGEKRTAAVSGNTVTIFFVTGDLFIEATGVADIYLVTVDAGEGGVFTALPDGANGTAGSEGKWTQFTVSLAYGADVYALILNQIEMKVAGAPYQTLYDWNVTVGEREWLFSLEDDITIEARYAQEKVSVSIVLPDGTIRSEEVTYNRELDLGALNIAVEGYTISGWRKGDELLEGGKTLVTAPVAIYAVASANTYEVTLVVSEDEKKTITVTFGEAFAYADGWVEIPVRLGHTFVGWKKDGVTVSGNQIVGVLEEGYTLIAEWSVNKYTVTFHANGGHLNGDETIAVGYGETFDPPIAPEREGYTFEGWEYNFVEWNFEKDAMPAENITLVAKWSMKKYTVTFVNGTEQSEAQYSHGATVTQPNAPTKNGYTFLGWYAAESETAYDFTTLVTSDLTLSAKWSAVQYTITYILNGGANGENPATYTVETDTFEFKAATRTGYVFVGWYDKESGGAEVTEIEKGSTGNVTLYAIWRANEYVVKFESNGGTQIAEQTIAHGGKATQPNAPTKNGYTFLGWYAAESETAYDFTTLVTSELTLSAKWSAVQYTITYILNGGANGENPAAYTVETDTFELKTATRTGYVFVGWYDKESGGAEVTEIEKGSTGNVTLYAIWRANEYVVKFESNGGTQIAEQTIAHGGTVEYTVAERENHLFVGWFTDESLTQSYSFNSAVKESFTLYAKWRVQKIVGTAEDGVTVMISSDSGFDDGTKLVFVRVTEEELLGTAKEGLADHMTLARLYDISLVDANGVSVPLSQPVSVGISVEGLTDPEGRYGIAYIPETGEAEELAAHIGADGRLYFFVEHFSHYAIVDIVSARGFAWWWILVAVGGCAVLVLVGILIARSRRIYELNYVNGGIASQRLKESSLIDLPLPEREDEVFVGWYYDEEFRDRALLTTMPKQNLILFAKWRRMTEEEREMRDRNRAEAAAAAAEGFHEAETENEKP